MLEVTTSDGSAAAKFGGTTGGQDYAIEIGQLSTNGSPGFNNTGGSSSCLLYTSPSPRD